MRQKDAQCQVAYTLQRISSVYYVGTFGICFFQTFYAAFFSQIYFLEKKYTIVTYQMLFFNYLYSILSILV